MKARIPLKSKFSKKTLEEMTIIAKDEFNRFVENDMGRTDRRYKKLFSVCLAMDKQTAAKYGADGWDSPWGKRRIEKLITMVEVVSDYLDKHDEIAWKHIDDRLRQIGISFESERE